MRALDKTLPDTLADLLGASKVVADPERRLRLSRDFYRYSQVLEERLDGCVADAVAFPESESDVVAALRFANGRGVPVTVRGAGTGNYGQAVPLEGGLVLDMTRMDRVLEIGDGFMRAESGARLGAMERRAREEGQELRIFPSTYKKSTVAGFVAGGSGGIGSVTHGQLWDGNVLGCRLVTAEEEPKILAVEGEELFSVVHAYGTTGIMTEVTIPLAPAVEWTQLVTSFVALEDALHFSDVLSRDDLVTKRLVSVSEAKIGPLLNAYAPIFGSERHLVLLWVASEDREKVLSAVANHSGTLDREIPYGEHPSLSDLSWNHTTLWARKVDPTWTYLQAAFSADHEEAMGQVREIKGRYGDEILLHFEYVRGAGEVFPAALPLLRYISAQRIDEVIAFFETIGVSVANPHTHLLEAGGRKRQRYDHIYQAKSTHDPGGILNPGKLRGPVEARAGSEVDA